MLFGRKTASESAQETAPPAAPAAAAPARPATVPPAETKRLGQILIEEGLITTSQLEAALAEQARSGAFLGQVLVNQGAVSQAAVSSCLVKQCKIPHLSLLDYEISADVLALIPVEVCQRYHLLPIDKLGRILTVAMVDPLDTEALEVIRQHCGELKIKPILCNWEHYDTVSAKLWRGESNSRGPARSITAESLGLGKLIPKPTDATPTPLPPPSSSTTTTTTATPAPTPRPTALSESQLNLQVASAGASAEEISTAIRSAMNDAVRAISGQQPQPAAAPDMTALAEVLRQSVQEAVTSATRELRSAAPASGAPVAGPDLRELGTLLQQSVHDAVSAVAQEMRQGAPAGAAPVPAAPAAPSVSPEQMAALIQESVGGAMQEALAVMVTQFKALAPRRDDSQAEALSAAVRDGVREAVQSALSAQQEHGQRLTEIAQATLQSVQQTTQLFESASVTRQNEKDLQRSGPGRHASVASFRGGISGTMDTDNKVVEALENNRPAEAMTFDTFVPGNVNGFTFKVSQQIATQPGGEFNPLFLYGHVGAGKTHLISAIGNHVLKSHPNARVGYVSASHFARRLKEAIAENALDAFRENYAHWDILILDDIQFLAGRVEAQEEFFHIFNALLQQGRQIIIASDKSPDRLGLLEQRLISRFASGIVTELKAPEWEARMAILRQQAKQAGVSVPEPILSLIAMRVADDVRKLTGCLRKIIAYAQLGGKELTVEMAEEILSHLSVEAAA